MNAITITPTWDHGEMSQQGQPIEEILCGLPAGNLPGSPVSIGAVSMPPGHAAKVHVHHDTWIYVFVITAGRHGVATRYGPQLEHIQVNHPGDILVVAPGTPHGAINLSPTHPVTAIEFRVAATIHDDNNVLSHLQHLAEQLRPQHPRTHTHPVPPSDRLIVPGASPHTQSRSGRPAAVAGSNTENRVCSMPWPLLPIQRRQSIRDESARSLGNHNRRHTRDRCHEVGNDATRDGDPTIHDIHAADQIESANDEADHDGASHDRQPRAARPVPAYGWPIMDWSKTYVPPTPEAATDPDPDTQPRVNSGRLATDGEFGQGGPLRSMHAALEAAESLTDALTALCHDLRVTLINRTTISSAEASRTHRPAGDTYPRPRRATDPL